MVITKRIIIILDLIVVIGSLLVIAGYLGYVQPQVIAPKDGEITANSSVLFSFANADVIYIDDNPDFTSPMEIHVKDNIIVSLKPGAYYWKIKGIKESRVHQITIASKVDLQLRKVGEQYNVVNAGNTKLNVEIYDKDRLVGNLVLSPEQNTSAKGDKFEASQDG